jgi:adenosylhomocysteinase
MQENENLRKIDARGNDEEFCINDFFREIVTSFNLTYNSKVAFITVNHLVPTFPYYLNALKKTGPIAGVIKKAASSNKDVLEYTETNCFIIPLTKKDLKENPEKAIELIINLKNENNFEKFVFIDIGGYFAPCLNILSNDPRVRDFVVGFVEDTENGLQKYLRHAQKIGTTEDNPHNKTLSSSLDDFLWESSPSSSGSMRRDSNGHENKLKRSGEQKIVKPVVSVARDKIKETEDVNVGVSIVRAADTILRIGAHTILERMHTVGIIGFGKIGKSIGLCLKQYSIRNVMIYDINSDVAREAASTPYNFSTINDRDRIKFLSECDMIFCATGNKSLVKDDFKHLRDNVFISSCTSADDEFDLSWLDKHSKEYESKNTSEIRTFVLANGNRIQLLRRGNSTNFAFNAVNGPGIYAVQAAMIISASHLARESLEIFDRKTGTHENEQYEYYEISESCRNKLSRTWLNSIEQTKSRSPRYWGFDANRGVDFSFPGFDDFTSRIRQYLIHEKEDNQGVLALSGESGVGKTLVTFNLLSSMREKRRAFFTASTETLLLNQYSQFAREFKLNCNQTPMDDVKSTVKEYFELHGDFVIIYDDAPDLSTIETFLPTTNNNAIVVTTKNKNCSWAKVEEVPVLSHENALQYVADCLRLTSNDPLVKKFVYLIETLPLNMIMALNHIKQTNFDIADFLNKFETIKNNNASLYDDPSISTWLFLFFQETFVQRSSTFYSDYSSTSSSPISSSFSKPEINSTTLASLTDDNEEELYAETLSMPSEEHFVLGILAYYSPCQITLDHNNSKLLAFLQKFLLIEKTYDGSFFLHSCIQSALRNYLESQNLWSFLIPRVLAHLQQYLNDHFHNPDRSSENSLDISIWSHVNSVLDHAIYYQMYDEVTIFLIKNENCFKEFTAWSEFSDIVSQCCASYRKYLAEGNQTNTLMGQRLLLIQLQQASILFYKENFSEFSDQLKNIDEQLKNYPKKDIHTQALLALYWCLKASQYRQEKRFSESLEAINNANSAYTQLEPDKIYFLQSKEENLRFTRILRGKILYHHAATIIEKNETAISQTTKEKNVIAKEIEHAVNLSQEALSIFDSDDPRYYRRAFNRHAKAKLLSARLITSSGKSPLSKESTYFPSLIRKLNEIITMLEGKRPYIERGYDARTKLKFFATLGEAYFELAKISSAEKNIQNKAHCYLTHAQTIANSLDMKQEITFISKKLRQIEFLSQTFTKRTSRNEFDKKIKETPTKRPRRNREEPTCHQPIEGTLAQRMLQNSFYARIQKEAPPLLQESASPKIEPLTPPSVSQFSRNTPKQ